MSLVHVGWEVTVVVKVIATVSTSVSTRTAWRIVAPDEWNEAIITPELDELHGISI